VEIRETQGEEGSWDSFREVSVLGGMGMEETWFVNPRICELQALTRKSIYIITFALAVLVYSGVCSYVVHSHLHDLLVSQSTPPLRSFSALLAFTTLLQIASSPFERTRTFYCSTHALLLFRGSFCSTSSRLCVSCYVTSRDTHRMYM